MIIPVIDSYLFPLIPSWVYNFATGCKMASAQIKIGKILVLVLVSLLLCGIVAAEFPELLSLTDNTANDFTVSKTNPSVPPVRQAVAALRSAAAHFEKSAPVELKLHFSTIKLTVSSDVLALHSVLRP